MGKPGRPKGSKNKVLVPTKKRNSKIDVDKAIDLHERGLKKTEIAAYFSVTVASVSQALAEYIVEKRQVAFFRKNKAHKLALVQKMLLESITVDEIKKMSPASRGVLFGILFDKERLETGQSTSNISTVVTNIIENVHKDRGSEPPKRVLEVEGVEVKSG